MKRYLISFEDGAMDHIPTEEMAEVDKASHAVIEDAVKAGAYVFGIGVERQKASVVTADGTVTDGPDPEAERFLGGFVIVDAETREEGLAWATRIADACRCPQEVREISYDPDTEAMLRRHQDD
ncbi:YciI family protein [Micromonospora schwarzwaldensis]|uniref:YciI family protein n=1 Tax=Micromonospora sp. DSM 45708 TaxID=3111767 RepID=UPI0031DA55F7